MGSLKRWVIDFFGLSHGQANGFILLILLMVIMLISEPLWRCYKSHAPEDYSASRMELDSIIANWERLRHEELAIEHGVGVSADEILFRFNPNRATEEELRTLGFTPGVSRRIVNYVKKGGKVRTKRDLLKIYGLDSAIYNTLYAFIDLPEKQEQENRNPERQRKKVEKFASVLSFDINDADSVQLKKIYGIGNTLSARIVNYRKVLGGFVLLDQIREVYGLDSAVANRLIRVSFVADDFQPLKLNINNTDEATLAAHPYLKKSIATAIVAYRFQHGEFKGIDDLRKIHALDNQTIQKIAPYLTIDGRDQSHE